MVAAGCPADHRTLRRGASSRASPSARGLQAGGAGADHPGAILVVHRRRRRRWARDLAGSVCSLSGFACCARRSPSPTSPRRSRSCSRGARRLPPIGDGPVRGARRRASLTGMSTACPGRQAHMPHRGAPYRRASRRGVRRGRPCSVEWRGRRLPMKEGRSHGGCSCRAASGTARGSSRSRCEPPTSRSRVGGEPQYRHFRHHDAQ